MSDPKKSARETPEWHDKPQPNVGSPGPGGDPQSPPPLMPQDGGEFTTDPEGTTDTQFMRIAEPRERPNSTSEPE